MLRKQRPQKKKMTHTRLSKSLLAVSLSAALAAPTLAHAVDVQGILRSGLDFGGEKIVTVPTTDGNKSLNSNQGLYLGGGVAILDEDRNFELDVTLAFKFALIHGTDFDVTWTRLPLDVLAFYRFEHVRLGGGLTYVINPRVEGSEAASTVDTKFKNALGGVVQVDWLITRNIATGLRYTFVKYEVESAANPAFVPANGRAKANGVGVTFSWNFP
jgi:hypothetical protein